MISQRNDILQKYAEKTKEAGDMYYINEHINDLIKDGKIRLISNEYVGPGNYSDQNRTQYCNRHC